MFTKTVPDYPFTTDPAFRPLQNFFEFLDTKDYASDFGQIVFHKPIAVFSPPKVELLQQFLKLATKYQLKISCRGKGNSAFGQSQCLNGVIIELKNLEMGPEFISAETMKVPGFHTWLQVSQLARTRNQTVPVTIDNLDLTVAGTLCFGAIGGTSYLCGSGADNVLRMEVLTMDGRKHICSKTENTELYNAVLCGLGQFGIILNLTIPLISAKKSANMYLFTYDNISEFFREQKILYQARQFNHLKGFVRKEAGNWEYVVEAASYYDDGEPAGIQELISQLSPVKSSMKTMDYWEFINIVTGFVHALREAGKLNVPHPWYNVFMPEGEIEKHLFEVLDTTLLEGTEPIIVYPMNSSCFNLPLFIKPNTETFYLCGVLYNTSFQAREDFEWKEVLARNSMLYSKAKFAGGTRYSIDAIHFGEADWQMHYGSQWQEVCRLKEKYDPHHVLSTGFNWFPVKEAHSDMVTEVATSL